jgi:hypothetical protein
MVEGMGLEKTPCRLRLGAGQATVLLFTNLLDPDERFGTFLAGRHDLYYGVLM